MKINGKQKDRTLHLRETLEGYFILSERTREDSPLLSRPRWEESRIVIERDEAKKLLDKFRAALTTSEKEK